MARLIDADELQEVITQDWFLDILLVQNGKTDIAKRLVDMIDSIPLAEEYNTDIPEMDINELIEEMEQNDGWIPCNRELPPQPKENPQFDDKPLELYLVSLNSTDYPWRAFWNGKCFTDGWSKIDPIAWQPLPAPYQQKGGV